MTNRYLDKISADVKGIMSAMERGIGTVKQALGSGVTGPAMRMRRLTTAEGLARNRATFATNKVGNPEMANKYLNKAKGFQEAKKKVEPVLDAAKTQQRQAQGTIFKKSLKGAAYGTVGYNAAKGMGIVGNSNNNNSNQQYY